ncbi:MAG: hypothetical protein C5B50_09725 [Verrucomicrobia bacterium]|nr:MAG: hypothetical protein C5B50_09725 [Verrucomicrobiota bacterium]
MMCRAWLGATVVLFACCLTANSQVAVPVGAGSYASFVPPADAQADEYYGLGAQQIIDLFPNLHLDALLTNQPLPSNKWWTDVLVGDRSSYNAANTPPRTVAQDALGGQLWALPVMLAPNSSGFNLYFPNSWNTGTPPVGGFNTGPALSVIGAIPLAVGSNDVLIADFDETNYPSGWSTTGTAFGSGPIQGGSWPGQSPPVTGFLGAACVNTYRGSDSPTGTLTSPTFTIQKHYIELLSGGGNDLTNDAVWLVISNQVAFRAAGQDSGALNWNIWDVSPYQGQTAQIKIVDTTGGGWGHVMCSWIVETDNGGNPATRYTGTYTAARSSVTGWSDWGFQFGLPDASGRRMDITLARGVPFVWTTYTNVNPSFNIGATTIYDTNNAVISLANSNSITASAFAFDYQGRTFGVFAPDNTTFTVSGTTLTAQLSGTSNYLVYALLPARTNLSEFAQYAYAQVTGTRMDWIYDRTNGQIKTTWTLTTAPLKNSQTNTLQGWLPHHYRTTQNNLLLKPYGYLTPRGQMQVAAGTQFQINYNFHGIAPMLPAPRTNGLPNDYVQTWMQTYAQNFANAGHPNGDETYGAGKDLGVAAQYMTFAHQMGLSSVEAQLKTAIEGVLQDWYTYTPGEAHHFFALYTNWPALVGFDASYGSQAFNDNHFHYGYFMVASGLVGLSDPAWIAQYGPLAKMVAKEYANWDRTDLGFPFLRTFDIWEGHSWAGGTSSGGGENQESSSEAMNSWVGLFMLGNALNDDTITSAGAMGYAIESSAVNEYWQDMYRTNFPASYGRSMCGILGSGSLSYATFFDGDPAWVYGIQMVPQNHWNNYLARTKSFATYQFTNLWNDRLINLHSYPVWTNTATYASGTWVQYSNIVWSANSNLAAGQPAPGQPGAPWTKQRDMTTSTANDLGGYLGNYILGWELLFNPDDVASLMNASHLSGGAISSDGTYSGITYYLTHSLRGLGDPDPNYYTSIPTSQVYYNAQTGARTSLIFNPSATTQTAILYSNGVPVTTFTISPGTLNVHASPVAGSFEPTIARNTMLSWPTAAGNNYKVQWTTYPTNGGTWSDLTGLLAGNGATNNMFDPLGINGTRAYRVLEYTTYNSTNIVNGGFESGTGANAANWTSSGSEPPFRVNTNAHSGSWSMLLANTNPATGGIQFQQDEKKQGAAPVIPGLSYTFSFWAEQILNGAGLVQNYKLTWLDTNSLTLSAVSANFVGGSGYWAQILASGLIAPSNAVEARFTFSSTTGATSNPAGEVLIDDVLLSASAPGPTNTVAVNIQQGWQVSWPSANNVTYGLQTASALGPTNTWTDFGSHFTGNGQTISVFDPVASDQSRFYRIYAQP